jgi:hypothetical protein
MVSELRPRGIGEILDSSVALYRARFTRLVRVAAVVVIPVQVLSALVLLSAQPDSFAVSARGTVTPHYTSATTQLAAALVIAVVGVLSTAFIVAACARVIGDAYIDRTSEAGEAFKAVRPRVFAIVGTALIVVITEGLGFLACFIGALVPLTFFAVAIPALILEGIGVSAAIGRSVSLTKSHVWHVLGLVLTTQLLATVLNFSLAAAAQLVVHSSGSTAAAVIGQSIANVIAGVLTTPFVATATVILYFDLRVRDEAFDVQLLMQRNDARSTRPAV